MLNVEDNGYLSHNASDGEHLAEAHLNPFFDPLLDGLPWTPSAT